MVLTSLSLERSYSLVLSLNLAVWKGPSLSVTITGDRVILSPLPRGNIRACATISNTDVYKCEDKYKKWTMFITMTEKGISTKIKGILT